MWSATENGTYWAAAKLLEEERTKPKATAASGKRKASDMTEFAAPKKSKTQAKIEAIELMQRIMAVTGTNQSVYDSGPEVVKKIKAFLEVEGVTKSDYCAIARRIAGGSAQQVSSCQASRWSWHVRVSASLVLVREEARFGRRSKDQGSHQE